MLRCLGQVVVRKAAPCPAEFNKGVSEIPSWRASSCLVWSPRGCPFDTLKQVTRTGRHKRTWGKNAR
ncbi:hypothetical protein E2C01_016061 [Portunus trituberculatus]|uniref:Uncharacterized protein n=1 Tax=Portunus trituberculatus TaxID=210409 RepID=A0A5B7DP87_PORTR|nr:hypothetical protein [Portunus trituberculatus]